MASLTQAIVVWALAAITLLAVAILFIVIVYNKRTRKRERLLYKQSIALLNAEKPLPSPPASARPQPDEAAQTALLEKIDAVMRTSDEIYSEDFSILRLAELVGSNRNYVSQVINDRKQCNFNVMLNEYRIKEACRRLLDNANYGSYTIEGIARSVGFKSRSYFASVFRDITGLTPSAYQKMSGGCVPATKK